MACFIVPVAEAIVTTAVTKIVEAKEKKLDNIKTSKELNSDKRYFDIKTPFSKKLKWLSNLLWGGSFLLAFEHLWHGELVPWFPFLTTVGNSADIAETLHELSTVGVAMSVFVTIVWVGMVLISNILSKRKHVNIDSIVKENTV